MTLNVASYIMYIIAFVHIVAIGALWTRREALAGLLILPIVVNILGFHVLKIVQNLVLFLVVPRVLVDERADPFPQMSLFVLLL